MSLIGLDHYVAGEVSTLKGVAHSPLRGDQPLPNVRQHSGFPYHKLVF